MDCEATKMYSSKIFFKRVNTMMGSKHYIILFLITNILHSSTINEMNTSNNNNFLSIYSIKTAPVQARIYGDGKGLFYNSPNMKLKVEKSIDSIKTGAIVKINPFHDSLYIKFGANYLNQSFNHNDSTRESISQHSGALGVGYMLYHDLDLELGSSVTELVDTNTDPEKEVANQTIKKTYVQLAKRSEISIGAIDITLNGSQLKQNIDNNSESYGSSISYYPNENIKLGYAYTNNQNNISNGYGFNYGYFTTAYTNSVSQNTYAVTVGFKAKFTDITNLSSYKMPTKIKAHPSRLHRFDDMVLNDNMKIHI